MPDNTSDYSNGLLDDVVDTPTSGLKNAIRKVDGITPDEEDRLERKGQLDLRDNKRTIDRYTRWSVYLISLVMGILFCSRNCLAWLSLYPD